jgi:8-amino-7-oxononanoate synthase
VLDDTQALGVLGRDPDPLAPYGRGGGGSLRRWRLDGAGVMTIASLAKGFGAPLAVLAGSARLVERFEARSDTRVYTSPPSSADIHAAERALAVNASCGDRMRRRLAALVQCFRRRLSETGLAADGGCFPVQTLRLPRGADAVALHARLDAAGIRTVLQRPHGSTAPRISFLLTAGHHPAEIDRAVEALTRSIAFTRARSRTGR